MCTVHSPSPVNMHLMPGPRPSEVSSPRPPLGHMGLETAAAAPPPCPLRPRSALLCVGPVGCQPWGWMGARCSAPFAHFSPGRRRLHAWRLEVSGPGFSGHAFSLLPTRGAGVARAPLGFVFETKRICFPRGEGSFFMFAFRPFVCFLMTLVALPAALLVLLRPWPCRPPAGGVRVSSLP